MPQIESLFVTRLYRAALSEHGPKIDPQEMEASCFSIAEDDEAGQAWCEENGYPGYTSYASLTDLPWRFPIFGDLVTALDAHVAAFAEDLEFDLDGRKLVLEDLWINILPEGGMHASHIHPHSVISGTTYVSLPEGASALKLEDPRSARMMAARAVRRFSESFFESSSWSSAEKSAGRITAAHTTGPASGPRPASSRPAIWGWVMAFLLK